MAEQEEKLTEEEMKQLEELTKTFQAPAGDEKHNVHTFLNRVANSSDTTKTGNLTAEEVGIPKLPLRTFKECENIAKRIINNPIMEDYFRVRGEILTSTSLSKDAKLITLGVIQRKEIGDVTKPRTINKGWFKKSEPAPEN